MAFSGLGNGILGDPYQITTMNQYKEISNDLDKHFIMMNDIDAAGGYIVQNNLRFTGVFDGQNFTIDNYGGNYSNMYLLLPTGATIKNLKIKNYSQNARPAIFSGTIANADNRQKAINTTFENITIIGCNKFAYITEGCTINNVFHFSKDLNEPTFSTSYYIYSSTGTVFNDCFFYFIQKMKASSGINLAFFATSAGLGTIFNRCSIYEDFEVTFYGPIGYGNFGILSGGRLYTTFNQCNIGGVLKVNGELQNYSQSARTIGISDEPTNTGLNIFTDCHIHFDILTTWGTPQTQLNHFLIAHYGTFNRCFVDSKFTGFTFANADLSTNTDVFAKTSNIIPGVTSIRPGVTLLSDIEATDTANFTNFDFINIWESAQSGQPKLRTANYNFTTVISDILVSASSQQIDTEITDVTVNLLLSVPEGGTIAIYSSNSVEGIDSAAPVYFTPVDTYNYIAHVPGLEGTNYYKIVYLNGATSQELPGQFIHYTIAQKPTISINVVSPNYKTFDLSSDIMGLIHGSLYHNGFIYGSSRQSSSPTLSGIVKINAADYSEVYYTKILRDKAVLTNGLKNLDQICYLSGFIWAASTFLSTDGFIVRIDPVTLDYMVFNAPEKSTWAQPIGTDGENLYFTGDTSVFKLDVSLLLDTFAAYGYNGSGTVNMPGGAVLGSSVLIQKHPTINAYSHAIAIDNQFIYVSVTSSSLTNGCEYGSTETICTFQKIDKFTMLNRGVITIPKCTDDIVQNGKYVFLAPELSDTIEPLYGLTWSLFAIDKQTLKIYFLKAIHSDYVTNNAEDRSSYGVQYYSDKIILQLIKAKKSVIIDTSNVNLWGETFPVGGATELIYQILKDGVITTAALNEMVYDNNGQLHVTTWETPATILTFNFDSTGYVIDKTPIIQTSLKQSNSDGAILGGFIIDQGKSPMISGGFKYGTDPGNLTEDLPVLPFTYDFENTITGITGIYFGQAYGTNTEGTFYGNIVIFSTYNSLTLLNTNAAAALQLLNSKNGFSIRCVQDAPGEVTGTTGTATDIDGNIYDTIVINERRWMVQNLKTKKFRNGEDIPEVTDAGAWQTAAAARTPIAANLNHLSFTVPENQTAIGTIDEPDATFLITSGDTIFDISDLGVITFKVAPDYETQSYYILLVTSSKGKKYKVTVNVTDVNSTLAYTYNTPYTYATTY